jgi:hypothetical protein
VVHLEDLDVVVGTERARREVTSFSATFTPTLMLGDITIAISRAAARISSSWAAEKPVVPMTSARLSSRHAFACASVPSGRVKSMTTSAFSIAPRASSPMSNEEASVASPPAFAASMSARPMRPLAPAMATRTVIACRGPAGAAFRWGCARAIRPAAFPRR